jgi:acylphosphatase
MQHFNIRIYGKVHDTLFRSKAQEKATELGITGFVRNEDDGSVYIEAEGERWPLIHFVEWCGDGPPLARVDRLEQDDGKVVGFEGFEAH